MRTVTLVSKPLGPPWADGSSRLVSELVEALAGSGRSPSIEAFVKPGYRPTSNFRPLEVARSGLRGNVEISERVARGAKGQIQHYFFAPHRAAVLAARFASTLAAGDVVQTICSRPASFAQARGHCFGYPTIALSRWTRDRLIAAGVDERRVVVIAPPLRPLELPSPSRIEGWREKLGVEQYHKIAIFPGDAEPGGGLGAVVRAACRVVGEGTTDVRVVVACREKTALGARRIAAARRQVDRAGASSKVYFVGRVNDFHGLLAACDLCLFPASTLYTKVDYPYAVLESMSLQLPIVVYAGTALEELVEEGGGVCCSRGAERALASLLESLSHDENGWRARGQRARGLVARICDPDSIAARHRLIYEQL